MSRRGCSDPLCWLAPTLSFSRTAGTGASSPARTLHLSATVVGLWNLFWTGDDADGAWAGAVATAADHHPGQPLIGYERGEDLAVAMRHGFHMTGPLRVWLRTD